MRTAFFSIARPVAGIGTHSFEGIERVETAEAAVDYVVSAIE